MRWLRSHRDDIDYVHEVGDDGGVERQVEVVGAQARPAGATSLTEWMEHLEAGQLSNYTAVYSHRLADQPVTEWDSNFAPETISYPDFQPAWSSARTFLEQHGPDNSD